MLFNYLKVAFRALIKKKTFAIINITGLSVGATASLLIFLYVQGELSYDKQFADHERIYRMVEDRIYPDRVAYFSMIPPGFATVLHDEVPEVEVTTRLVGFTNFATNTRYEDKQFAEHYFFGADSNFFEVMPYRLIKGNMKAVLRDPNSIVLTLSTAARYFGDADPMGKRINLGGNNNDVEVVGVMEDLPENSHLKFDALVSIRRFPFIEQNSFYISGSYTYVKLAPQSNPAAVESKFPAIVEKYAAGQIEREIGVSFKKYVENGNGYKYFLQPLSDIHLHSHRLNEIKAAGSITAVRVLSFIGIMIVAIAGINFVNLATARSAERAREVGVRKVLGSRKRQLIGQFLSESLLITAISMIIAIVMLELLLTAFNNVSGTRLQFDIINNPTIAFVIVSVTIILGVIAGLYPALFISNLKPVAVLKGKFRSSGSGQFLRNGLVVFQFSVSIILISATLVVYDQLEFIQNKTLGFDKQDVLVITHNANEDQAKVIQDQLRQVPGVEHVAVSNTIPGGYYYGTSYRVQGSEELYTPKGMQMDDEYATTMKMKVVQGRLFSPEFDDSLSIVINQRAATTFNLKDPVGTVVTHYPQGQNSVPVQLTIVGVVEDFHFESLHTTIAPLVIHSMEGQYNFASVLVLKLEPSKAQEAVAEIESKWKDLVPDQAFNYNFLDGSLSQLYVDESRSGKLLMMFSIVAIVIACVGLFGLAAYIANQRTKEIGVRKVLGASVSSIVGLLSKDFFKLVAIALVIGTPMSLFLVRQWLESFAYRVPLSALTFIIAAVIVMFFTAITISYQAINASLANPTNSLKEE
jgi:putative ABC transport system permease protein